MLKTYRQQTLDIFASVTNGDAVRQFPLQLFVAGGGQEPDDPKLAVDFEEVDAVEHRDVVV